LFVRFIDLIKFAVVIQLLLLLLLFLLLSFLPRYTSGSLRSHFLSRTLNREAVHSLQGLGPKHFNKVTSCEDNNHDYTKC